MITFIIPSVNRPTLTRSIYSLIKQTNPKWKCIIVFDGIEKVDYPDKRILSISIEKIGAFTHTGNAGLVRNKGIRLADTEWIGFLDDDDTLDENYVDWLHYYNSKGYDVVLFRMIFNSGRIIPAFHIKNEIIMNESGISFCYKRILDQKFINASSEDYLFLTELKKKTEKIIISDEIAYYVRPL